MKEYRILCDTAIKVQTILNQWRHQYELEILAMTTEVGTVTILLTRKELT